MFLMSRYHRIWTGPDALDYLAALKEWRRHCVSILAKAPIRSPIYSATTEIMTAIDGAVEVITGDRTTLHTPAHSTPKLQGNGEGR